MSGLYTLDNPSNLGVRALDVQSLVASGMDDNLMRPVVLEISKLKQNNNGLL